jgi:hypothetical protein
MTSHDVLGLNAGAAWRAMLQAAHAVPNPQEQLDMYNRQMGELQGRVAIMLRAAV